MGESRSLGQLPRTRYLENDPRNNILEYLYRAQRFDSFQQSERHELLWFYRHPEQLPATYNEYLTRRNQARGRAGRFGSINERNDYLNALRGLVSSGYVTQTDAGYRLSDRGFDLLDEILRHRRELPYRDYVRFETTVVIFPPSSQPEGNFDVESRYPVSNPDGNLAVFAAVIVIIIFIIWLINQQDQTSDKPSIGQLPLLEQDISQPPLENRELTLPESVVDQKSLPDEPIAAAFIPLDLRQASDANGPVGEVLTLGGLFEEPLVELLPQGIAYGLSKESAFLESESATSERSNRLMLEVGQANVRRVYLLLNLCNTSPDFTGGANLFGKPVGQVTFYFSQEISRSWWLIAGVNIRDWIVDLPGVINERYEEDAQIEVLRNTYNGFAARIDQVTVDVPEEYRGLVLERIEIVDLSRNYGTADPGIVWFGVALEVGE